MPGEGRHANATSTPCAASRGDLLRSAALHQRRHRFRARIEHAHRVARVDQPFGDRRTHGAAPDECDGFHDARASPMTAMRQRRTAGSGRQGIGMPQSAPTALAKKTTRERHDRADLRHREIRRHDRSGAVPARANFGARIGMLDCVGTMIAGADEEAVRLVAQIVPASPAMTARRKFPAGATSRPAMPRSSTVWPRMCSTMTTSAWTAIRAPR